MVNDYALWLGTLDSFRAWEALDSKAVPTAEMLAEYDSGNGGGATDSPWLRIYGSVAVISVSGSLIEGRAGWRRYYGYTGYDDLREAAAMALQSAEVGSILLHVGSHGGHVAGVHETAQMFQRINKVKPVVTYGATMLSAALWIGSSARYVVAGETSQYGSLGILQVHIDRSAQLEKEGIKVNVIRAGAKKALATPYEPLSKEAKEQLEKEARALYDVFLAHVASARGVTEAVADDKFGQGVVFTGAEGKSSGLVDKIGTYEDAFTKASTLAAAALKKASEGSKVVYRPTNVQRTQTSAQHLANKTGDNATIETGATNMSTTQPLTEQQIAAMAAGVVVGDDTTKAEDKPKAEETTKVEDKPKAEVPATDALAVVQGMLTTAQAEVATLKLAASGLEAKIKASDDALKPFAEIARASVKNMIVALNAGGADKVATMSNTELLAEHTRLADMFKTKFKAGGVAATANKEDKEPKAAELPLAFLVATNLKK